MKHNCKLRRDFTSNLTIDFPDYPWYIRWRRKLQQLILVSKHHPETFRYLKSTAAIEKERHRQVKDYPGFIIHPLSEFRKIWNILMFLLIFINQMKTSFALGFFIELEANEFNVMAQVDIVVSVLLLVEVFLRFRTGYVVKGTNQIVLDPVLIAKNCLVLLVPDLISCIPFVYLSRWTIKEDVTINKTTLMYIMCLFLFSFYRLNRMMFYFSSVPMMLNLSEKSTIVIELLITSFYW